ncbi:MAG TPA: type II secretion system protein [Bacillales bacterium]|nr:type II secretion system protein [Bacillales bacterium]
MLKNRKGFSLVEVMAALTVLTITAAVSLPLLIHVYQDREAVHEELRAANLLQNHLKRWIVEGTAGAQNHQVLRHGGTTYRLTWNAEPELKAEKICITWYSSKERRKQKCGYAKMPAASP